MEYTQAEMTRDIERVKKIGIVPTLLDVICQTTGMGFAAVARVTKSKWITCSVRDDIQFGLVPGSELILETTICNEIRDSLQPVIIDHVAQNKLFCNHHTPLMYGFQSYISFPIILKSGEFFGTLCAIDPNPAQLENSRITGMFMAFTDLISFHLQQVELLEESDYAVRNLSRQLTNTLDENRQYRHISHHSLQEPLRKLRVFSGMLIDAIREKEADKAELLALKINSGAERFSGMIRDLSDFSVLDNDQPLAELTDLNLTIGASISELNAQINARNAVINLGSLPSVQAFPSQLEQLFYHLLHNAIKFSKKDLPPIVTISSKDFVPSEKDDQLSPLKEYIEIKITDNGMGIDSAQAENIFDMFSKLPTQGARDGEGFGLTFCRKIIRNHGGLIKVQSQTGQGTSVTVILPTSQT